MRPQAAAALNEMAGACQSLGALLQHAQAAAAAPAQQGWHAKPASPAPVTEDDVRRALGAARAQLDAADTMLRMRG